MSSTTGPGAPRPPGGAPPATQPLPQTQPVGSRSSQTDGVSIAALVTGILGLGVIPVVLGIVGLERTTQRRTQGRGMAITGVVLGILQMTGLIIGLLVAVVLLLIFPPPASELALLRTECAAGNMWSCDELYRESPVGSASEEFGWTCGGRTFGGGNCTEHRLRSFTYSGDADLDALWDECAVGDDEACDDLCLRAPYGSEYEDFGDTCGGRQDGSGFCVPGPAELAPTGLHRSPAPSTREGQVRAA